MKKKPKKPVSSVLGLRPSAFKLLFVLCRVVGANGETGMTMKAMASASGLPPTTVKSSLDELTREGLVQTRNGFTVLSGYLEGFCRSVRSMRLGIPGRTPTDSEAPALSERDALTAADEVLILRDAAALIGVNIGSNTQAGLSARSRMRQRWADGATRDTLLAAARYAAQEWDNGNKNRLLKKLSWIWRPGNFEAILAGGGEAGKRMRTAPQFKTGEERHQWLEEMQRRIDEAKV